jgi:hypothetical protein
VKLPVLKAALRQSGGDWDWAFWRLSAEAIQNLAWWIWIWGSSRPIVRNLLTLIHVGAVLSQRNFFVEGEACGGTRRQAAIPDLGHFLHYPA